MDYVKRKVHSDYNDYSGFILERWFRQAYAETGRFDIVTNYWEKGKGGEPGENNEIDLIAVDSAEYSIVIGECKRNPEKYSRKLLEKKAAAIVAHHKNWKIEFIGLSLNEMK